MAESGTIQIKVDYDPSATRERLAAVVAAADEMADAFRLLGIAADHFSKALAALQGSGDDVEAAR